MSLLHILPRNQKALHNLLSILLVILSANILSSCSKDLIYFPKSVQEEVDKTLDNGYDGTQYTQNLLFEITVFTHLALEKRSKV